MFSETARYYDKIYSFKKYEAEAQRLMAIIGQNLRSQGHRLLDVACGTGRHIEWLKEHFDVEGLDISPELIDIARQRNPGILFHCEDMADFDLGHEFAVVTCLFGSIGYVKTLDRLVAAVACMRRHLMPGGILLLEPWFTPDTWNPGTVHAVFIDEPDLKIARLNTSFAHGRLSYFDFHYLIGTPEGTRHFVERHELGLFEMEEMHRALADSGLALVHHDGGLTGRGLLIGRRPS